MRAVLLLVLVGCGGGKGGAVDGQQMGIGNVGRVCDPGTTTPNETVIASPSLDCDSRMCLSIANSNPPMCTARCRDASDCEGALESACSAGFTCAPVMSVGPFACESVCVCSDRVPPTSCTN
jgi:hypothetical protein